MKRGLELFIESIEKCYQKRFIPRVVLVPMAKPAYKEVTIEVYLMHGANKELYAKASNVYMVTNEDEKERAIDDLTEDIIAIVLKRKA
jgi:hypothetical protein